MAGTHSGELNAQEQVASPHSRTAAAAVPRCARARRQTARIERLHGKSAPSPTASCAPPCTTPWGPSPPLSPRKRPRFHTCVPSESEEYPLAESLDMRWRSHVYLDYSATEAAPSVDRGPSASRPTPGREQRKDLARAEEWGSRAPANPATTKRRTNQRGPQPRNRAREQKCCRCCAIRVDCEAVSLPANSKFNFCNGQTFFPQTCFCEV